jgi:SHS2 domain-containing protein
LAEERYRLIEHTGDLAFVAYGKDVRELFQNAAFALFDVYADLSKVEESIERQVDINRQIETVTEEQLFHFTMNGRTFTMISSCPVFPS